MFMKTKDCIENSDWKQKSLAKGAVYHGWLLGEEDASKPMTYAEAKNFCAAQKLRGEAFQLGSIEIWHDICVYDKENVNRELINGNAKPLSQGKYWVESGDGSDGCCIADVAGGNIIGYISPEAKCLVRPMRKL